MEYAEIHKQKDELEKAAEAKKSESKPKVKESISRGRHAYRLLAEKIVSKKLSKKDPAYKTYVSAVTSFLNALVNEENTFFIKRGSELLESLDLDSLALNAMQAAYEHVSRGREMPIPGVFELRVYNCGLMPVSDLALEDPTRILYFKQHGIGTGSSIEKIKAADINKSTARHFIPLNMSGIAFDAFNLTSSCEGMNHKDAAEVMIYRTVSSEFSAQLSSFAKAQLPDGFSSHPSFVKPGSWEDYCCRALASHASLQDIRFSGKMAGIQAYSECMKRAVKDEQSDFHLSNKGGSAILDFSQESEGNKKLSHAAQEYLSFLKERFKVLTMLDESTPVFREVFGFLAPTQLLAISDGEEFISKVFSGQMKAVRAEDVSSAEYATFADFVAKDVGFVVTKAADAYEARFKLLVDELISIDKDEGKRALKLVNAAMSKARKGIKSKSSPEDFFGSLSALRDELTHKITSLRKQREFLDRFEDKASEAKSLISELESEFGLASSGSPTAMLSEIKTITAEEVDVIIKDSVEFARTIRKMAESVIEEPKLSKFLERLAQTNENISNSGDMAKRFIAAGKSEDAVMALQEGARELDTLYLEVMEYYSGASQVTRKPTGKLMETLNLAAPKKVTFITNADLAMRSDLKLLQINSIISSLKPLPGVPKQIVDWADKHSIEIFQFKGEHRYFLRFTDYEKCNEHLKSKKQYSIARLVADAQEKLEELGLGN